MEKIKSVPLLLVLTEERNAKCNQNIFNNAKNTCITHDTTSIRIFAIANLLEEKEFMNRFINIPLTGTRLDLLWGPLSLL
jgi:hypothetical protein